MRDYYEILGIPKNAKKEEIKKAYHKLAHKYHPDKSGGDEQKFKEINEAYQVLADDKKRAEYDRYGRVFSDSSRGTNGYENGAGYGFNFEGFENAFKDFDFSDIFEDFFAGGRGSARARRTERGRDVFIDIEISFKEMVFGAERRVVLNKPSLCEVCRGTGADPKSEMRTCEVCKGAGSVKENKRSIFGTIATVSECGKCKGRGKIPDKFCEVCRGEGVLKKSEEIIIKIPPGIDSGEMIKISGKGEAVANGISGDLYVKIHVQKDSSLVREGYNIIMNLDIPMSEAILGGERVINFLGENLKIKIPKGTDSEDILKLKGKGIFYSGKNRGDLLVKIKVRTPKKLSRKAEQLIEELKKEGI